MTSKRLGRQTVRLAQPPSVVSYANIGGKFEGNGPLAEHFDQLCPDSFFGKDTWEQAESAMQQRVLERALEKGGLMPKDLDYVLAGDLLNQCIGTAFGLRGFDIPFFGLYGACSTMGESLALGSLLISGGHARMTACMTSSHFCTAERQYRYPLEFGCHRLRLLHPGGPGGRPVYHPRYLREDRGQGHHRREQHGGRHGPRRLRHPVRPVPGDENRPRGL